MIGKRAIGLAVSLTLLSASAALISAPSPAYASDDDCAIWLCLPYGFPEGCDPAYQVFVNRIKNNQAPMPPYATCSAGGLFAGGDYSMGFARYEACPTGFTAEGTTEIIQTDIKEDEEFVLSDLEDQHDRDTVCVNKNDCKTNKDGEEICATVEPKLRERPFFVDTIINGQRQKRYYFRIK